MRIKNFQEFKGDAISENYGRYSSGGGYYSSGASDYYKGKTKFIKWMRSLADDMKAKHGELVATDDISGGDMGSQTLRRSQSFIPLLGRLIFGAGAAIADFFSKGDSKDSFSKLNKAELKSKEKDVLSDWEKKNLEGKKVTKKDAEDFYKSGVLKGKKYFGGGFDPMSPKNKEEETYSDYLGGAMSKYYERIDHK